MWSGAVPMKDRYYLLNNTVLWCMNPNATDLNGNIT